MEDLQTHFNISTEKLKSCLQKTSSILKMDKNDVTNSLSNSVKIDTFRKEVDLIFENATANIRILDGYLFIFFNKHHKKYSLSAYVDILELPSKKQEIEDNSELINIIKMDFPNILDEENEDDSSKIITKKTFMTILDRILQLNGTKSKLSFAYTYKGAPLSKNNNRMEIDKGNVYLWEYY